METLVVGEHTFQIIDTIPLGYQVWKIGKNMPDGYLPLCRLSAHQPFPGGRNIETDTLKAIRCKDAQAILAVVSAGPDTVSEMELYVKKHRNAAPGSYAYDKVQKCKVAIPAMRAIDNR